MRTPGREPSGARGGVGGGSAERLPSPWTSLAATAAGDVAAGAPFSPAQAHQIAAATAAAVAAAAAAVPPALSLDARYQTPASRPRDASAFPRSSLRRVAEAADSPADSPPTPAQAAVARAEVALLEAKMEALREQLAPAVVVSARMEAHARAAASAGPARRGGGASERDEAGIEKEESETSDATSNDAARPSRAAEKGKAPAAADPAVSDTPGESSSGERSAGDAATSNE